MFKTRLAATVLLLAGLLCAGTMRTGASPQGGAAAQGDSSTKGGATAQSGAAAQGGAAQSGGATAQTPTFRGGIDFIRVDVFVSDRSGKPITDLKETDFEVAEDGKPQKVEQFRVIKIEGNTFPDDERIRQIRTPLEEEEEARRDDVRLFAFFLDEYHVRDRNAIAVRAPLTKFIETQVRPTDMLAVMYPLTPVSDVLFTRDHEAVINAIHTFEGRKYDYTPRNEVERQQVDRNSTDTVEKLRNQVVSTALESLTMHLGGLRDGRKSVIFVSEGFTVLLPPQMRRQFAEGIQPLSSGAGADPRIEAQLENAAQLDLDSRMRDVYKSANRNNTAFYPLDPRGLAVFEFDLSDGGTGGVINQATDAGSLRSTQETLRNLALETGGRAIINRNTLTDGLAEMMRDSSFYYLLGYTSQATAGRQVSRHQGAGQARRRRCPIAQGFLGLHRRRHQAVVRAQGAGDAETGATGVGHAVGASSGGQVRSDVGRDRTGRERQDARDARLGAAANRAGGSARAGRAAYRCSPSTAAGRWCSAGEVPMRRRARPRRRPRRPPAYRSASSSTRPRASSRCECRWTPSTVEGWMRRRGRSMCRT